MSTSLSADKRSTLEVLQGESLPMVPIAAGEHFSEYSVLGTLTDTGRPVHASWWRMMGRGDLSVDYQHNEAMFVHAGVLAVRDDRRGVVHRARVGEIMFLRGPLPVTFLAESRGLALCMSDRKK